jgi:CubicO group peptidase (beta-lactamase class C family)
MSVATVSTAAPKLSTTAQALASVGLTQEAVNGHVISPDLAGATSFHGPDDIASFLKKPTPIPQHTYKFDAAGFCTELQNDLKSSVAGYIMRMRQNGSQIYELTWNWAEEPQDGSEGWGPNVRMHVASCSKLVTAIAMTKLFDERSISFGTKIIDYLPAYWTKGPGVDQVTFANLLTQHSGFNYGNNETSSDYEFMKQQVATGTTHVGTYNYQNMNFGLCRILLSTVNGNIPVGFGAALGAWIDPLWDLATIQYYEAYVTANVFGPGRVSDGSLAHVGGDALAYNFPVSGNGWNSGDLTAFAGGAAWHLSVDDLLGIMGAFRRENTIVTPQQAQTMLDAGYGLDLIESTPLGTMYAKNGGWADGSGRTEQCVAFFLPEGIEVAVFVNSPIGTNNQFLMGDIAQYYLDNVK